MAQTTTTKKNADGQVSEVEIVDAAQDSIELSVNAKGEPSFSVKVYGSNDLDLESRLARARALAEEHVADIRAKKV